MENTTFKFETTPIDNATLLKLLGKPTTLADIDELIAVQGDEEAHFIRVVRCKDCKFYQDNNGGHPNMNCRWIDDETPNADDYCSYGERKEDEIH